VLQATKEDSSGNVPGRLAYLRKKHWACQKSDECTGIKRSKNAWITEIMHNSFVMLLDEELLRGVIHRRHCFNASDQQPRMGEA
jgi:hypothetical protein